MNPTLEISVILPTHDPLPDRLRRTLVGLRQQSLPHDQWELLLVDNASTQPEALAAMEVSWHPSGRILREPQLGLSSARATGLSAARGAAAVFVDDDNLLAPDYLVRALECLARNPQLGAIGGKSLPEFEIAPPEWTREFFPLLALRDLGDEPVIALSLRAPGTERDEYPSCAPIGAGMALRRAAWISWLSTRAGDSRLSDRRGKELTSGGDNDIVLCVMRAGWGIGYFPELSLTHLVPAIRLEPGYLGRLNRGIQKSWMQVLTLHAVNPWSPLTRFGASLRKLRAWFRCRAWNSPAARIRWEGACGHFDGRVRTR